ncbi:MAG: NAD-dependent epimerase/dehydratase family protein [Pseudomonadota bacterium]
MRVFVWETGGKRRAVAVFGLGLVGGAIAETFTRRLDRPGRDLNYPWGDAAGRAEIRRDLSDLLSGSDSVDIVWSAGRSGFGSDTQTMATETGLVRELVDFSQSLTPGDGAASFHLLSSAGGLFEGISPIERGSVPCPLRPYGTGKEAQEALLSKTELRAHIYRPSSVYGYRRGARLGLVAALLRNAQEGSVTRIAGANDTVRDYVLAEDMGQFIAARVLAAAPLPPAPLLLASGRPAAIGEIVAIVRRIVERPVLLQYATAPDNARHMSFRPSALPKGWRPTALETGIRLTARSLLGDLRAAA